MTYDKRLPKWAVAYAVKWIKILDITHWEIKIEIDNELDPNAHGKCRQRPDINYCHITIHRDIEENDYWKSVIIHELLHVAHARVDSYLQTVVELLPAEKRGYDEVYEPFIDRMCKALVTWEKKLTPR